MAGQIPAPNQHIEIREQKYPNDDDPPSQSLLAFSLDTDNQFCPGVNVRRDCAKIEHQENNRINAVLRGNLLLLTN